MAVLFRVAVLSFSLLVLSIPASSYPVERVVLDQVRQASWKGLRHESNRQSPQTSPTTTNSATVNLPATAAPTVSSTSVNSFSVNSATTAPLVSSTVVGTSSIVSATTTPPSVSSAAVSTASATSSVVTTTTTASSVSPTTTTPPSVSSAAVSTASATSSVVTTTTTASSVSPTTTTPPSVSSAAVSPASATSSVITTTTTASSVSPTTTTPPSVSTAAVSTASATSSVITTTTTASSVSPTTTSSSAFTSTRASTSAVRTNSSSSNNLPSTCQTTGTSPSSFRMNVGGGAIKKATMGSENERYLDIKNKKADTGIAMSDDKSIASSNGPAPWDEAYTTYRWIDGSVLKYVIPVNRGTYDVKLLFAESVHMSANARQFDVYINGVQKEKALDVFAAVGKNVGLLKKYTNINSDGSLHIALIKSIDHPMLSGIIIEGPGAGAKAVGGGCHSPAQDALDLNGGVDHFAHAVASSDGPYVATDYDKVGRAEVTVDGSGSHTHYSEIGPPLVVGKLLSYRWKWTEIVNGTEVLKQNKDISGRFQGRFPVGRTLVNLEVVDNSGDVSTDYAEVDVLLSTKEGMYCYGYHFESASMPSVSDLSSFDWLQEQRPQYGDKKKQILFNSVGDFGDAPLFQRSFMYRCTFFLMGSEVDERSLSLIHNGPFVLYQSGLVVASSDKSGETELHLSVSNLQEYEVLYLREAGMDPMLELKTDGASVSAAAFSHDESKVLPIISGLSETESAPAGRGNLRISGSGFFSTVKIFFGENEATDVLRMSSKLLQVTIPPGQVGEVTVTVKTRVAISNGVKFMYVDPGDDLEQPIVFETMHIQRATENKKHNFRLVASVIFGPDFRLYLGTTKLGLIHAVGLTDKYKVRSLCTHKIEGPERSALGLTFSPFSNKLRLYFSSSTTFWKNSGLFPFEEGWVNGKIESVDFSRRHKNSGRKFTEACSYNQREVVTGLPVSGHDHAVNKLEFTPDGRLLITIGGFTNGGISIPGRKREPGDPPDDAFGGVASNPFSAAVVSCPVTKVTRISYDNYTHPQEAKVVTGEDCFVYASGIRNSFGMTLHTNGHLYVTDNGGSKRNGDFATDCNGGSKRATDQTDKLFRVERGGYHGHPNLNRRECVHYPPDAVQPILGDIESSTDGVIEYRSNIFGGRLKGDLVLTKFATHRGDGRVSQVKLNSDGGLASGGFVEHLHGRSGVAVAEGPRGELVMPQVQQAGVLVSFPKVRMPTRPMVFGVLPKRGPARGRARVLVSGHMFSRNSTVWFGERECTRVRYLTDKKLVCSTPPAEKKNDAVSVVVEGPTGRTPTFGSDYWYF